MNYTSRVLAAAEEDSIVLSDQAKVQVVQELGSDHRDLVFSDIKVKMKGFDEPYKHKLWIIETRKMRRAAEARNRRTLDRMAKDLGEVFSRLKTLRDKVKANKVTSLHDDT